MTRASLIRRIEALESRVLPPKASPALFVCVVDTSLRDPDSNEPREPVDHQASVIGCYCHPAMTLSGARIKAQRITRADGESISDMQARARRLVPAAVLFSLAYGSLPWSLAAFEQLPEVGAGGAS
jgi:hypothetical protein